MRRTPLSTSSPAGATTAADWRGRTTEPRAAHEAPTSLTLVKTDAFLENQP
jgi:hypothetical protein